MRRSPCASAQGYRGNDGPPEGEGARGRRRAVRRAYDRNELPDEIEEG